MRSQTETDKRHHDQTERGSEPVPAPAKSSAKSQKRLLASQFFVKGYRSEFCKSKLEIKKWIFNKLMILVRRRKMKWLDEHEDLRTGFHILTLL